MAASAAESTSKGGCGGGGLYGQSKKRARTVADAAPSPVVAFIPAKAAPAVTAADLVQAATQCDLQRLQRLLSFRNTPQPHLDQALTAALTAEVDEAVKAERQRCVVLLLARGATLVLPGQAEMQDSLSVFWPIVTCLAVTVYAGEAAAQAVQGACRLGQRP